MSTVFNSYDLPCFDCSNEPLGKIPLMRVIDMLDRHYAKNDLVLCEKHLRYWIKECAMLEDLRSELSLWNEMIGLCRRLNDAELAFWALDRITALIDILHLNNTVSCATIFLNMATTYKHFGKSEEALALYQMVENTYNGTLPIYSYEYAALYNNKAASLIGIGRYEEAMKLLLNALDVLEHCPKARIDQVISYGNLAQLVWEWRGDRRQAEAYLDMAWDIICAPDILHDGKYAFVCAKSSEVYALLGKEDAAIALAEVAREIYEGT